MNDSGPINMEELFEIMDDDSELIKDCFDEFIISAPEMLEKVKSAIDSKNPEELQSCAHKMKGSLKYLAAEKAAGLAYDLEKMGNGGELEHADTVYTDLEMEYEKIKKVMAGFEA